MPALFVLLAAALWGLIGPISRFALQDGITALEIAFWRAAVAAALFFAQAGIGGRLRVARKDVPGLLAFGIVGVAFLEASNLITVEKGGAAFGALMLYSAPAWVALGAWAVWNEKLPPRKLLAVVLSVSGVAGVAIAGREGLSASGWSGFSAGAIGWGMVSGLSYAAFYFFGAYYFRKYSPWTALAYAFPVGALAMAPFVEFRPKSLVTWAPLLFLGFASTYLAYFFYSLGLRRMNATRAAVIASIEPLVAAAGGWWVWGERLSAWGYFWGAWLMGGVFLVASLPDAEAGKEK